MRKILAYALLLVGGLTLSQTLPLVAPSLMTTLSPAITLLTLVGLAFIMIRVGHEFEIDRDDLKAYGKDYAVAMSAAALPWIFVTVYFVFVLLPSGSGMSWAAWRETLLAGRFAAPTSAGVLFAMLAAAGLAATWVYRKARVLAIFDDIDTVLLMIPLKMLIVGLAWQLGVVVLVMGILLWIAWRYMHALRIPTTWPWILGYAVALTIVIEIIYATSKLIDPRVPIHVEILLPAFVLGCVLAKPVRHEVGLDEKPATIIAGAFMVLVGLSLPPVLAAAGEGATSYTAAQAYPPAHIIALHVLAVTALCNLGKMMPLVFYRKEASLRERLGVCVAMFPRGEVGAGVLVVGLSYGIGGPVLTVAMLSLALNLVLTGAFIMIVKWLIKPRLPKGLRAVPAARRLTVDPSRRGPAWH
ncbi:MAG TPA: sodium:proton antiporter [Candidatus Thermoplasmatota archaeon]|nr:sodium:proton antiporter [Candidatus Thermoplasmatota archaeon]